MVYVSFEEPGELHFILYCTVKVTLILPASAKFHLNLETISKFLFIVTPAKAGGQGSLKVLDSGFRRNDARRGLMHFEIVS
mgnify:CR=1 FL=1